MPNPAAAPYDPYTRDPTFFEKHTEWVAAAAVLVLTVILTVTSFPPNPGPELAYAFAAPGIFWAYLKPRFKLYLGTMFLAQVIAWTILLGWLHHVTWLGLILLGPFVGAWVGSWYLAVWWLIPRIKGRQTGLRILGMFGLAALWVVIEWTRTWFLTGFPWMPLAATQWQRSILLQIASYTGAGGVSFILIVFNLGFTAYGHRLLKEKETGLRRRSPEFMVALLVLMFPSFLLLRETMGNDRLPLARISVVQPYIPQSVKWDPTKARGILDVLAATTERAASTHPDFIFWPEAVTPLAIKGNDEIKIWTEQLVRKTNIPLLLGSVAIEHPNQPNEAWYNGAFVVDPQTGLQPKSYEKRHLVPFGEYVPLRPLLGWLKKITDVGDDDILAGTDASPLRLKTSHGEIQAGLLVCYEDIFPRLARDNATAGADILVVLTNNGWFGEGGAAYQHAAHSVLRAVETRRPVVRCGNGGWSGWIDEFGNIRATMVNDDGTVYFRGTRTFDVTRDPRWIGRQSYYVQHGDWFVLVCVGLVILGVAAVTLGKAPPVDEQTGEEVKRF